MRADIGRLGVEVEGVGAKVLNAVGRVVTLERGKGMGEEGLTAEGHGLFGPLRRDAVRLESAGARSRDAGSLREGGVGRIVRWRREGA